MKKLFSSALKTLGFLTILLSIPITILTGGWGVLLAVYIIGVGLFLYIVDIVVNYLIKDRTTFSKVQISLATIYLLLCSWTYMKWQEHNAITFPHNFNGQAGIIFGMEGYPPLPNTRFWKKKIEIPDNGIIITSTKSEDLPNFVRFYFKDDEDADNNKIDWNPNFQYNCIINNSIIKAWLFTYNTPTTQVRKKITELANQIIVGKAKSSYSTDNKVLVDDTNGQYLWLQDQDVNFLPDSVSAIRVYKVILTGNNFTDVPKQILNIQSLEDLLIGHNPITEITPDIYKLKRLKSLTLNATKITDIKTDLSKLDSLEHFDFSSNETSNLPDQVKNIPNLTWLSLNDNRFKDLSFIDKRLSKLETLYLYTNEIESISTEIKYLSNLKELLIFDNKIDSIPDYFSTLTNLEKLEIWDNPIKYITPAIKKLQKLKQMRIDDDNLTIQDKENLKKWLPNCTINFQTRADK